MNVRRLAVLCAVLSFAVCLPAAHAAGLEAAAVVCKTPPSVDGDLGDACWRGAPAISHFHVYGSDQRSDATRVRVAVDSTWLYLAFECDNPHPDRLGQNATQHDGPVHTDDSIEVFLDPGTNGVLYYHYLLSFANVKGEKRVLKKRIERDWDVAWRSATKRTKTGWTGEAALPMFVLGSYGDLDQARINIARNQVIPLIDPYNMKMGEKRVSSSWSPVLKTFHETDVFAPLKGLGTMRVKVPFLVSASTPTITGYYLEDNRYFFDVLTNVRAHTPKSGAVELVVEDIPASGKPQKVTRKLPLKGNESQAVKIAVPADSLVQRKIALAVKDGRTGDRLQLLHVKDTSALNLMQSYYDRSYYTTEKQAKAICVIGMPAERLAGTVLEVKDEKGKLLGRTRRVAPESAVTVDLAAAPVGTHKTTIEFRREDGALIFSQARELVKRPPKPGFEIKIDRVNRIMLREGKPFYPFGLWLYGVHADNEAAFKHTAEAGFNIVPHWISRQEPEAVHAYQKVAAKHDLLVMVRPEAFCQPSGIVVNCLSDYFEGEQLKKLQNRVSRVGLTHMKGLLVGEPLRSLPIQARLRIFNEYYAFNKPRIDAATKNMAQYANVFAYNMFDEPSTAFQYEAAEDSYRKIYELDGYRPVAVFGVYEWKGKPIGWTDTIEHHPYWVPTKPGTANRIARILDDVRAASERQRRPFFVVHLAEFRSGADKRPTLPDEQFCQCYLAFIHGVKGLFFFRWPVGHQRTWETLTELGRQMKVLSPILLAPEVAQDVKYARLLAGPQKDNSKYPDVHVALMQDPGGGAVLLAANVRPYPVEARYRVSGLSGKVGRLFGAETLLVSKGAFSERLERYGVRAYTFPMEGRLTTPVKIAVETTARTEGWKPEVVIQAEGRTGKKNIVRNPGFEEFLLPDWPNYFLLGGWEPAKGKTRVGHPDALWRRDTKDPFQGEACLRIVSRGKMWNGVRFHLAPQYPRPTQYVFSAYMKADRDGVEAHLIGTGVGTGYWWRRKWITLTTEWKRYHVVGVMPAKVNGYNDFSIRVRGEGAVWIDAIQIEKGAEATTFED